MKLYEIMAKINFKELKLGEDDLSHIQQLICHLESKTGRFLRERPLYRDTAQNMLMNFSKFFVSYVEVLCTSKEMIKLYGEWIEANGEYNLYITELDDSQSDSSESKGNFGKNITDTPQEIDDATFMKTHVLIGDVCFFKPVV